MDKILKTITVLLSVIVAGSFAATPMQTTQDAVDGNWLVINGKKRFLQGMNIAWITNNSFGNDIGDTKININGFTSHIKKIRKAGGNAVRWWLHTDASNCPKIDATGAVTGIGSKTIENMRQALDTAYAYGVVVSMCLFSFDLLEPGKNTSANPEGKASYSEFNLDNNHKFLTEPKNIDTYLQKGLKPILESVGNHPAVLCWEVFNEPEGMLASANWEHIKKKITQQDILRITNKIAGFVHRNSKKMVSTGIASCSYVGEYSDSKLKAAGSDQDGYLDFYMLHYYPEWQGEELSPFHKTASSWNMDRPVLVGEFPAKDWSTSQTGPNSNQSLKSSKTIIDAFKYAYENGYAGAMSWQMAEPDPNSFFGNYETTAPALTALFNAHKNDIMINETSIEEMSGNYVMKLTLKNLPSPKGSGGKYNELGTSFSKDFSGKTNLYYDLYIDPNSTGNATILPVIKVGTSYTWSPATDQYKIFPQTAEKGKWITYTVPISAFNAQMLSDVREMLFQYWADTLTYTGTLYFDNVRVENDTLANFNTEGSLWGTGADSAGVVMVKLSDVTTVRAVAAATKNLSAKRAIISQGKSIQFTLSERADTRIELLDLRGSVVSNVMCGELDAGVHTIRFGDVPSGRYICTVYRNATTVSAHVVLH